MNFGITTKSCQPYVAPKINMFEEYKKAVFGKAFDPALNVPIMRWCSNNIGNIKGMSFVSKNFFNMPKEMIMRSIVLHTKVHKITKYPKKDKNENKIDFLIPYICKHYGWSEREYGYYKEFIDLEDIELHSFLDNQFGFDKKECRILGIKRKKSKLKFVDKPAVRGFF